MLKIMLYCKNVKFGFINFPLSFVGTIQFKSSMVTIHEGVYNNIQLESQTERTLDQKITVTVDLIIKDWKVGECLLCSITRPQ